MKDESSAACQRRGPQCQHWHRCHPPRRTHGEKEMGRTHLSCVGSTMLKLAWTPPSLEDPQGKGNGRIQPRQKDSPADGWQAGYASCVCSDDDITDSHVEQPCSNPTDQSCPWKAGPGSRDMAHCDAMINGCLLQMDMLQWQAVSWEVSHNNLFFNEVAVAI